VAAAFESFHLHLSKVMPTYYCSCAVARSRLNPIWPARFKFAEQDPDDCSGLLLLPLPLLLASHAPFLPLLLLDFLQCYSCAVLDHKQQQQQQQQL
jgi:hypothetical protein